MKKIILSVLAILLIGAMAYAVYFKEAILPGKIRSALISGLEGSTGKRVKIDSARLSVFRGLLIDGLDISDGDSRILSAKNVACRFLLIPVFKKEAIIASIKLDSPYVFVERTPDDKINIVELFFKKPFTLMDGKVSVTLSRIAISKGAVLFRDRSFEEPFVKELKDADIDIKFSPFKISFNARFEVLSKSGTALKCAGEYSILKKDLSARIYAKDLYPAEFVKYCAGGDIKMPGGAVDISASLKHKGNILEADAEISGKEISFSGILPHDRPGNTGGILNADIKVKARYDMASKDLTYAGSAVVNNLAIHNLDGLGDINDICGIASFTENILKLDEMTATVLGLKIFGRAAIPDLLNPVLNIDINSETELGKINEILKKNLNIRMPLDMKGDADLAIKLQYNAASQEPLLKGSINVDEGVLSSEYLKSPLEKVNGEFSFTQNQLIFKNISFYHENTEYNASGTITNFKKPGVQLELYSDKFSVNTLFSIHEDYVSLSELAGSYGDYNFSIQGLIDTANPKNIKCDLKGVLKFQLSENKDPYKHFKDKLKGFRVSGDINADFSIKGTLNNIAGSQISATVRSGRLSLNNFKIINFISELTHKNGISNISSIRGSCYGGRIQANGLIDSNAKDISYQINGEFKNIKIEEIKKEFPFKDKDVSGIVQMKFGIKGSSGDLSALTGWGKIGVLKGKLWQLDLFRGLGALFFRSDFGSVLFEEGRCNFFIKEKSLFTNDLVMKSSLIDLYGAVKISFDSKIAASLKVEFTDEGLDASRTSDIAGAIERYSVIEVKGTLDEPSYKIRPDLSNVVGDIADNFFS